MLKLMIGKNVAYPTSAVDYNTVPDGVIAIFDRNFEFIADNSGSDKPKSFSVVMGRSNLAPTHVDMLSSEITRMEITEYQAATKYSATVTVANVAANENYAIQVIKKGTVWNQRSTWTATYTPKTGETATDVAAALRKSLNSNSISSGITVGGTGASIVITGKKNGEDYNIQPADDAYDKFTVTQTAAKIGIGTKEHIEDLVRKTAGEEGFRNTHGNTKHIYAGYNREVADSVYDIYVLKSASPREYGTHDEQVNHTLYIAMPKAAGQATAVKDILEWILK